MAQIIESFEDHERRRIHIVMELCTGGSLVHRMKNHRQIAARASQIVARRQEGLRRVTSYKLQATT